MTVVLDTNVVVALYDAADPDHQVVADWIATVDEDLVATPLAVAEMDYLVAHRGGAQAREALWTDLDAGAYLVRWWADALNETLLIARRHPFAGLRMPRSSPSPVCCARSASRPSTNTFAR